MNCFICNTELKSMNTPLFGATSSDGQKVCTKCHRKLALKIPSVKIKTHTAEQIVIEYNQKLEQNAIAQQPLNELKEKIAKLNPSVSNKKEVKELLNILMDNEEIEKVDSGFLKEGKGMTGHGLLVATNYRLIFIDKSTFGFGVKMEDFPYKNITSVSVETSLLKSSLKIICSGNTAVIDVVTGAKQLSEFVRQKTYSLEHPKTENKNLENDILGKIEKLAELKEKGILSEDEFTIQKTKLLEQL